MSAAPAHGFMTIGQALGQLRADFPDVTLSKIRFLESEGLIEPARTSSGYRKFTHADVDRLRYVLRAQRDHYLPLRVIREHLDTLDRTRESPGRYGTPPRQLVPAGAPESSSSTDNRDVRLTGAELLQASGLDERQLRELEDYGLIRGRVGRAPYDGEALRVAKAVAELVEFGLEPRHLRAARSAAVREVGLVEQVVAPLLAQSGPEARERADEVAQDVAALSVKLHAALVQSELNAALGR